jgi:hypothetical protein
MIATARRCSTQQAACWYRLVTADQSTGSDPYICFAVMSRVLLSTEHKINKRTCNVSRYEMLFSVIYITRETSCDEGVKKVVMAHI